MKNKKEVAIWDMDGTLITSAGLHESAWRAVFDRHGIKLSKGELKE